MAARPDAEPHDRAVGRAAGPGHALAKLPVRAAALGGAAISSFPRQIALQKQREAQRREAMGKQRQAPKLRKPVRQSWVVRLLFMRISPEQIGAYFAWRLHAVKQNVQRRLVPVRQHFALLGFYCRRAVLALGVMLVSLGIAGGVLHGT